MVGFLYFKLFYSSTGKHSYHATKTAKLYPHSFSRFTSQNGFKMVQIAEFIKYPLSHPILQALIDQDSLSSNQVRIHSHFLKWPAIQLFIFFQWTSVTLTTIVILFWSQIVQTNKLENIIKHIAIWMNSQTTLFYLFWILSNLCWSSVIFVI